MNFKDSSFYSLVCFLSRREQFAVTFRHLNSHKFFSQKKRTIVKVVIVGGLTFAKSIFSVQQPEYMSAPCSVSFALVADSTESNVIIRKIN